MAEQKKAAEEAKMKELAKQIQQEREKAEMGAFMVCIRLCVNQSFLNL